MDTLLGSRRRSSGTQYPLHAPPTSSLGRGRASSAHLRSKFTVSYEALLNGDHPWLGPGAAASSSIGGTPLHNGTSSVAAVSLQSSPTGYFSAKGKKPSAPRSRFFADLLCLKVEPATLARLLDKVPASALSQDDLDGQGARIRDNIGSLWRECLRVWTDRASRQPDFGSATSPQSISSSGTTSPKDVFLGNVNGGGSGRQDTDEVRRANAAETLVVLSRAILAKKAGTAASSSLDLIWVFAGGIDEADEIFESLVTAIDDGIQGKLDKARPSLGQAGRKVSSSYFPSTPSRDPPAARAQDMSDLPTLSELLQHRRAALHLAIVWLSFVSSTNLSAYFVRRDLFVAVGKLLGYIQTLVRGAQAQQGAKSLAESDVALINATIRDVTLMLGLLAGLGQGSLSAGPSASSGYQGGLDACFSPYFRRLCDWSDQAPMIAIHDVLRHDMDATWRSYDASSTASVPTSTSGRLASSVGMVTESLMRTSLTGRDTATETVLPPASASLLLPLFILLRANQLFLQICLEPPKADTKEPSFAASLLSTTSYLVTHGAMNARARVYARLSLLTFVTLLSSQAGVTCVLQEQRTDLAQIRVCEQRSGPLPVKMGDASMSGLAAYLPSLTARAPEGSNSSKHAGRHQLLPYILDCSVQYLRHNLKKKLDSAGYLVCMHVIQLSIQQCSQKRVKPDYDNWQHVWAALISVAAFLAGRHTELLGVEIGKLGQALISTLGIAVTESDRFLPSKKDSDALVYELVRSREALERLATVMAGNSSDGKTSTASSELRAASRAALATTMPMWQVIDCVFIGFDDELRTWHQKRRDGGFFGVPMSLKAWTGGYLGGGSSVTATSNGSNTAAGADAVVNGAHPSPPTSTHRSLPGEHAVMDMIKALDLGQVVQRANGADPARRSKSSSVSAASSSSIDEAWIEQAESQCLAEAFRHTAEDMRILIAQPLPQ